MTEKDRLEGKRILIVDDEPDILDTLEDLLSMCELERASTFEQAKMYLESESFDLAILDIMGVDGYRLLEVANDRKVPAVMLTAHALSPDNIVKSFKKGAAYYIPKDEMVNITTFLHDIFEAMQEGKSSWWKWYDRLAGFCDKKFGPTWQDGDKDFWEKFRYYI